jgi:DNA primase
MSFPYDRQWLEKVRQGAERLKQGLMFRVERISEKKFLDADDEQKKFLLKTQFENLMKDSKVNLSENLHCPFHDDHTPSFKYFVDTKKFYCFARCFEDEGDMQDVSKKAKVHKDAFDLVGDLFNFTSYDEKYNTLVSWFVENPQKFYRKRQGYQQASGSKKKAVPSAKKSAKNVLATEDPEVRKYLNDRGIDDNMIQLFHIGASIENGIKLATVSCDNGFETRRNINFKPKDDQDKAGKYLNSQGHSVNLYNSIALKQATTDMPVIIVESTFDAMIIQSLGLLSTALNGITVKELIKKIEEVKNDELQLILLLDFDNEGERALKRIKPQMEGIVKAIPVYKSNSILAGYLAGYKDIGEAWVADKQVTESALNYMVHLVKIGFAIGQTITLQ